MTLTAPLRTIALAQAGGIAIGADLKVPAWILGLQACATIFVSLASILKTVRERQRKSRRKPRSKGGELL